MSKSAKTGLIIGGIVLAVVIIVPSILGMIFGWSGNGWGMMGTGMMGGIFGWMWLMVLLMVLFWIAVPLLVIWGIVSLIRGGASPAGRPSDTALEILNQRYARGEIDKKEYEEKKKDLS